MIMKSPERVKTQDSASHSPGLRYEGKLLVDKP